MALPLDMHSKKLVNDGADSQEDGKYNILVLLEKEKEFLET